MNYTSFTSIFDDFNTLNALIIGDVMVDAYIWGKVERISPEAPVPIIRATRRDHRLGGAANVALNVQALGPNPIICSVVGDDSEGRRFIDRLGERGISSDGIVVSTNRPTTVKTRLISANHHMVRIDEESEEDMNSTEQNALLAKIEAELPKCQVVIFEDYDKGCINPEVIKFTVELARKHNIPTVADPKKRNFLDYHDITLFKPNLNELKEGLKIEFDVTDQTELENAVGKLVEKLNCGGAMITLSEHGVYITNGKGSHHVPAHFREIADVSGAGDTVISIAALCVALGLPTRLIAEISNLGGGLVCEHVGVVSIDKAQLLQETEASVKLN